MPLINNRQLKLTSLFIAFFFLLPISLINAEDKNEKCLECHCDESITTERDGKEISLYVNGEIFSKSVHYKITCIACHKDADVLEFPHPERLKSVKCEECHFSVQKEFDMSAHGQALKQKAPYAPTCVSCHGKHNIFKSSNPLSTTFKMNIPLLCGKCHREDAPVARLYEIPEKHIIEHYRDSIHGEGLLKKGLLVTAACVDCHGSHNILPHTHPNSTISIQNIGKVCEKCHVMIEQVHKKVIKGELWEKEPGTIPACVDCHSPHEIRKEALVLGMADRDCLKCHDQTKPVVKEEDIAESVHKKIRCVKCHSDVAPKHERPCDTAKAVKCSECHVAESEKYNESIHGQLYLKKDPEAPSCKDCHGDHKTTSRLNDTSPTFRRNVPMLCAKCHRKGEKAAIRYKGKETDIVDTYQMSTHGKGVIESGLLPSAVCIDCHTSHHELPAKDPDSSVNPANLGLTCAKCHKGINDKFSKSIHSPKVNDTKKRLPVCEDCHTAHNITRVEKDKFLSELGYQCGHCHKDVSKTYFQTYHGKAYMLGYLKVAKCSDCHGSHDILRPSDPDSHLGHKNVVATCKKCHPATSRKFTGYLTHATHHNRYKYPILFYTFWVMTSLLIGVFGFFGIHLILWLPKSFARFREKRLMRLAEEPKQFVRFNLRERILHLSVIVSFFGLVITGMMLKFAYMPWAETLANIIGGVAVAGLIHRICALITFGYFGFHLWTLYRFKKKNSLTLKQLILHKNSLFPKLQDFREFWNTIKWFFGRGKRPEYGRWTYWEKFDYFAVFWGVAIIGSTGLMLWFAEIFTYVLPGWIINVATIIHSDEALLAAGFIFTIHFFNTHLRPESFPMDPVIFTGYTSLSELKHDRPKEYKELENSDELEKRLVPPVSKKRLKLIYVFGLTCLGTGIVLIILIIYSMLIGYK